MAQASPSNLHCEREIVWMDEYQQSNLHVLQQWSAAHDRGKKYKSQQ
jgi:hypothetical protein